MAARQFIPTIVLLVTCLFVVNTSAQPRDITDQERALLPGYCYYTQTWPGFMTEGYQKQVAIFGPEFLGFHHYCWGLINLMRAERHNVEPSQRRFLLNTAFGDIEYVVERARANNVLMPEWLTKQGMIRRRLDTPNLAIPRLERAIALDPKYWRAYWELAKCRLAMNDKTKAREALEAGLTQVPDQKVLLAMLKELDGLPAGRKAASPK